MESSDNNNSENVQAAGPWYRSAVATAVVGAVFSIVILALMVTNYVQGRVVDGRLEKELENLKIEINNRPDDEQLLLEQIRQLDLQFRRVTVRRLDFSHKGSYLLLASLVVFLIGIKCATTFKEKISAPQPQADIRSEQIRRAIMARWAVTGTLGLLGAVVLFLVMSSHVDFSRIDVATASYPTADEINRNWPYFRGPASSGISAYTNIPDDFNGISGEGVLWKAKVPLPGHNSPVVWGDRIFLSGGDPNQFQVYCFDALSGELLWTGDVARAPKPGEEPLEVMEDTGFAAATVATDGRRVYAIFATGDIGCFDFAGRNIWTKSLGTPDNVYGYSASLAMYRNLVLIQYDQGGDAEDLKSRLIAFDGFSGRTVWETKRPAPNSWASPIVVETDSGFQVITCADPWVIAYKPVTGEEIWRARCIGGDVAPSPIYAGGFVFAVEPYSKLVAIRPDGTGDVTKTHIAWSIEEPAPDICSPVSNGRFVFLLTSDGLLCCYKVADGTKLWEEDLREDFRASPSLVGDNLYLLNEDGVMFIIEAGPQYKQRLQSKLGEECYASPAFADGRIYIRGVDNLYCIGRWHGLPARENTARKPVPREPQ